MFLYLIIDPTKYISKEQAASERDIKKLMKK